MRFRAFKPETFICDVASKDRHNVIRTAAPSQPPRSIMLRRHASPGFDNTSTWSLEDGCRVESAVAIASIYSLRIFTRLRAEPKP